MYVAPSQPYIQKEMEQEAEMSKDMKVQIPMQEAQVISPTHGAGGLSRQGSVTKNSCLCSPTTHAGSFRCRMHRDPSLQRTKSIGGSQSTHNS